MVYSLCNLSITKNYKNLSNTFSSVVLKNIVKFVPLDVIYWADYW